jgi:hypothetical protein
VYEVVPPEATTVHYSLAAPLHVTAVEFAESIVNAFKTVLQRQESDPDAVLV